MNSDVELETLLNQEDMQFFLHSFQNELKKIGYSSTIYQLQGKDQETKQIAKAIVKASKEQIKTFGFVIKNAIINVAAQETGIYAWSIDNVVFNHTIVLKGEKNSVRKHINKEYEKERLGAVLKENETNRYVLVKKGSKVWGELTQEVKDNIREWYGKPITQEKNQISKPSVGKYNNNSTLNKEKSVYEESYLGAREESEPVPNKELKKTEQVFKELVKEKSIPMMKTSIQEYNISEVPHSKGIEKERLEQYLTNKGLAKEDAIVIGRCFKRAPHLEEEFKYSDEEYSGARIDVLVNEYYKGLGEILKKEARL